MAMCFVKRSMRWIFVLAVAVAVHMLPAAQAAEVLYEQAFGGGVKKPATFTAHITVPEGKAPYLLNLVNGGADGKYRLSEANLSFNGEALIDPSDLDQKTEAVNRQVFPAGENTLDLTLKGGTEGYVTIRILGGTAGAAKPSAAKNHTQQNSDGSLSGLNMRNSVALWFIAEPGAVRYVLLVAPAPEGPWQALQNIEVDEFHASKGVFNEVDNGDDPDTGEPRGETGFFLQETTYYRLEAIDGSSKRIKEYPVLAVPPYVEEQSSGAETSRTGALAAPLAVAADQAAANAASSNPCGSPCVENQPFIGDVDFTDKNAMTLDAIRNLLQRLDSFLQGDANHQIADVDGVMIDPARLIYDAAQDSDISPRIVMATIQKESRYCSKISSTK